jgi:imidazolonepropionase-like amidohydrolase
MRNGFLLLENGLLIDGTGADPVEGASVLIQDGRLVAVGPRDSIQPPPHENVVRVDATGKSLMPGMIDCHFHMAYQEVTCWEDYALRRSIEHTTLLAARNAQTLLEVGFTSARDTGTRGLIAIAVRDMVNAGLLTGPRIMAGSRILSSTGGLVDGYGYWVRNYADLGHVVDGVEAVTKAVRDQIKYGADNIKLEASGTGISPYSDSKKLTMTVEEMSAAVKEAHRNGVRVACHAQATQAIKNAAIAGVDTVEHGSFLDEEGAQIMKDHGTILVPTVSVLHLYVHEGPRVGIPDWVVNKFRGDLDDHKASVRLALEREIPMAVGSDSGHAFNPQSQIAVELELMVDTGFTPLQAIRAATLVGAQVIGRTEEVGTLEVGKIADVLVVDGNPGEDVSILRGGRAIERVYKGGRLVAGTQAPRRDELELGYQLAKDEMDELEQAGMVVKPSTGSDNPCCIKPSEELAE